ncbi:MAG TPA: hypothetical protein VFY82_11200 [Acidimicrobiales bacterium]|nr:hypothetical protein [Acidimicrobiales bacterium]
MGRPDAHRSERVTPGRRAGPHARLDPLTGRTVIVAPGRAGRPDTWGRAAPGREGATASVPGDCPFCPGNEKLTPPEIARTGPGAPGTPGWRTRVFPNRYPIVDGGTAGSVVAADDLRPERSVAGVHEVVVLSPDHEGSLGRLDPSQATEVLTVLRDRARVHAAFGRRATQVFVNHGAAGGASLPHPHAQVIAIDLEPPAVRGELDRITTPDGCLVCREIGRHGRDPELVVASASRAELWCPWAAGTAYEMLLAPTRHQPRFEDADEEDLGAVGELLHHGLERLDRVVAGASYQIAVHSRPARVVDDYHWHLHMWPRLQREAGFEHGSGLLVNVVDPARATADLRRR